MNTSLMGLTISSEYLTYGSGGEIFFDQLKLKLEIIPWMKKK